MTFTITIHSNGDIVNSPNHQGEDTMADLLKKVLDWTKARTTIESWCDGKFSLLGHTHSQYLTSIPTTIYVESIIRFFTSLFTKMEVCHG